MSTMFMQSSLFGSAHMMSTVLFAFWIFGWRAETSKFMANHGKQVRKSIAWLCRQVDQEITYCWIENTLT